MGITAIKTATISMGQQAGLPKAAEQTGAAGPAAPATAATDPTVDSLQEMFDNINGVGTADLPAPEDDPFLALRFAVEGNGGLGTPTTNDFAPVQVPTVTELVALDPSLNTFADGYVEQLYGKLRIQLANRKVGFEQKIAEGMGLPAQIHVLQQMVQKLEAALLQVDAELTAVASLQQQALDTYAKEITLLQEVGLKKITPEDADLNHDGYIGNPTTTDYLIGYQTIDDENHAAVLLKDSKTPVQYDATGMPIQGNVRDPHYTWTIAGDGVAAVADSAINDGTHEATDLTLELGAIGVQGIAGNHFGAQVDIAVPEYVWVKADPKHPEKPLVGESGHYVVKPFDGLTQQPPADGEKDQYLQIKVTDLVVSSDNAKPVNWPPEKAWTHADGTDQILTLKDKNQQVILQIRIAGRQATATELAATDFVYDHQEFVAASSVGLAFNAGSGDLRRLSPINFTVESNFVSTGQHFTQTLVDDFAIDPPATDDDAAQKAWRDTLDRFTGQLTLTFQGAKTDVFDYQRGYTTEFNRTGVFVTGLKGNLVGSQFNDFFDIPSLTASEEGKGPEYQTTVDAGAGYNAVVAGTGDHDILGATFVQIKGAYGDRNSIRTSEFSGAETWDGEKVEFAAKYSKPTNPRVYVTVDTPGGQTFVGNPRDSAPTEKYNADDYYDINSGDIGFTDLEAPDKPWNAKKQIEGNDLDKLYSDAVDQVGKFIAEEAPEGEAGAVEGAGWEVEAEYYNQAKDSMDAFFKDWNAAHGLADEEEEESADMGDIDAKFGG